ncbi:hypothetical protein M1E17_03555 [Arthrobacter sp. D1-29]
MPEDDHQAAMRPAPEPFHEEPFYEPIGGGWINEPQEDGDDAGRPPRQLSATRVALRQAADDWLRSIRTVRFWGSTVIVVFGAWLAAAAVIGVRTVQEDPFPEESQLWTYILASAFMAPAAALLAVHWGRRGISSFDGMERPGHASRSPLADFFATAARGFVFAVLALVVLLVHAGVVGAPGGLAVAAAGLALLEFAVFGALAAGISAWLGRSRAADTAAWALAWWLVLGNLAAVWALFPAVRSEEPVTVVLNIERGPDGVPVAYDCAAEIVGVAEVFHTERIMWLAAPNPMMIFVMVAAGADGGSDAYPDYTSALGGPGVLGWFPMALQATADGTQVPCVNSEPKAAGSFQTPLVAMGLAIQGGLAVGLLAAGHHAARRRVNSERVDQGEASAG